MSSKWGRGIREEEGRAGMSYRTKMVTGKESFPGYCPNAANLRTFCRLWFYYTQTAGSQTLVTCWGTKVCLTRRERALCSLLPRNFRLFQQERVLTDRERQSWLLLGQVSILTVVSSNLWPQVEFEKGGRTAQTTGASSGQCQLRVSACDTSRVF